MTDEIKLEIEEETEAKEEGVSTLEDVKIVGPDVEVEDEEVAEDEGEEVVEGDESDDVDQDEGV